MSPTKIQKGSEPGFETEEDSKVKVPNVQVRNVGKVDGMLNTLAEEYKKANPGMGCRWVYSPLHRPDLSNTLSRQAQGYKMVKVKELSVEVVGMEEKDTVRVGDLVLMGIAQDVQDRIRDELEARANEQAASVDRKFYEEMENVQVEAPDGTYYGAKARGKISVEEKLHEYDIDQRTSED